MRFFNSQRPRQGVALTQDTAPKATPFRCRASSVELKGDAFLLPFSTSGGGPAAKALPFSLAIAAVLLVAGCWSSTAHAQGIQIGTPPAPVQYTVYPEIPGPNESVTIEVAGVGSFIGNSPIIWTLNGKVAEEGIGKNKFTFQTGSLGAITKVGITIRSTEHGTITNAWTFNPSSINLVWEAQTTVPPLYMGKALYSVGSPVTVYAFPQVVVNGKSIANSSLSFQWKLNDQAQPSASGLGRTAFAFNGNQLHQSEEVSVDVFSGNIAVGHATITIGAADPQIMFYIRDPLRGVLYNTALQGTYAMPTAETTLHAEPYYYSRANLRSGNLAWSWTINGSPTSGPNSGAGELTLRSQGGQGNAIVGVALQNTGATTFLQAAKNSITLLFGNAERSTGFGL
jgi:hypothetical protein